MPKFNLDSKIKEIIENKEAIAIMESYIPGSSKNPQLALVRGLKIKSLIGKGHYAGLTPEQEKEALEKLFAIE